MSENKCKMRKMKKTTIKGRKEITQILKTLILFQIKHKETLKEQSSSLPDCSPQANFPLHRQKAIDLSYPLFLFGLQLPLLLWQSVLQYSPEVQKDPQDLNKQSKVHTVPLYVQANKKIYTQKIMAGSKISYQNLSVHWISQQQYLNRVQYESFYISPPILTSSS